MPKRFASIQGHPDAHTPPFAPVLARASAAPAHGVEGLKRNGLNFRVVHPVAESFIDRLKAKGGNGRTRWLEKLRIGGRQSI